jgi:GTPase
VFTPQDIQKKVTKALLIGIHTPEMALREAEDLLAELKELVENLQIEVVESRLVKLREPNPHFLVGSGKAAELIAAAKEIGADVIVFDDDLSPAQQRNWEAESKLCVIDRHEVILDIFADRAHTREAILQVGLARMEYSLPRLKRAWTHLSRQRGGGTGARGQGETQLESDRRLVKNRIAQLRENLVQVVQQRQVQRQKRLRKPVPTAAIVGYTNAGKSTLLNRLTGSTVLAEDKLFATLDPTTRQLDLPDGQRVLISDTVGFVRRLPHGLIEAFKATLEEVVVSDFLIHVVDASSPEADKHLATTLSVLGELGADKKRMITVFNKIDRCEDPALLDRIRVEHPDALRLSAATGEGIGALLERMAEALAEDSRSIELLVPHSRYDLISKLHEFGGVQRQETLDEGVYIQGIFAASLTGLLLPYKLNGNRPAALAALPA